MDMWNHRPDRCYPAAGYKLVSEPNPQWIAFGAGEKAEFQTAVYALKKDDSGATQIFWSWSSDGKWKAPDDLRGHFDRTKPVFKLYFQNMVASQATGAEEAGLVDFIKLAMPEYNKALFGNEKP